MWIATSYSNGTVNKVYRVRGTRTSNSMSGQSLHRNAKEVLGLPWQLERAHSRGDEKNAHHQLWCGASQGGPRATGANDCRAGAASADSLTRADGITSVEVATRKSTAILLRDQ